MTWQKFKSGNGVHGRRRRLIKRNILNNVTLNLSSLWLTAEDPFQCLAACINLSEALKSSSPHTVISHLPIHHVCASLKGLELQGKETIERIHWYEFYCEEERP